LAKYEILISVLDRLRDEAIASEFSTIYLPQPGNHEAVNQSRSRALLHLYLKVSFGLLSFPDREHYICDGRGDGGIDAYYISKENRTIYFLQSKFRTTATNFENKNITLSEILVMDVNRVLDGESFDSSGNPYNSKIQQLQAEVKQIDDIGRYKYCVLIIANVPDISPAKLALLSGGFKTEVWNYEKCYSELVFPVICGTYFTAADVQIALDLSNKNAGTKINYEVRTQASECEITALFVPIAEIARVMGRYKNSILKFNPRSYLDLEGKKVNNAIRETVIDRNTNEFALFNNGITMLSDETHLNERIGQRNKAQLTLRNPQIINGGQTAYTLSRILVELGEEKAQEAFSGKEVLLKIITFVSSGSQEQEIEAKIELIDQISTASNQQTPVIPADRLSNEKIHQDIQRTLFERYGLLYERKRGEFSDGLTMGYVSDDQIVERNLLFRLYMASTGQFLMAMRKKLFSRVDPAVVLSDLAALDRVAFSFYIWKLLQSVAPQPHRMARDRKLFGKLYASTKEMPQHVRDFQKVAQIIAQDLPVRWQRFTEEAKQRHPELIRNHNDKLTGERRSEFSTHLWIEGSAFMKDVEDFF
jgi:hypothetical protein